MMKYIIVLLGGMFIFASCQSQQSQAKKLAGQITAARPGTMPTSEGGWTMKAKIAGKSWTATSIMPPEAAGRIVGYYENENIGLPYNRRDMYVGKKIKFSDHNAVDLVTHDDIGMWGGRKGEMLITKVSGNWAEGTFFFTGSTTAAPGKTIEVTDGFFRISLSR